MTPQIALVVGFGVTGQAVTRRLLDDGWTVEVVDDRPSDLARERAAALGVSIVVAPDGETLAVMAGHARLVVPSPGVPVGHPVYAAAERAGVPLVSEIEVAARQATVPIVAVTGTNGKTTVTTMIAAMLVASGRRAVAAGNIGLPLVDAVHDDVDVVVAEVSSFQLQFTDGFHPAVALWLNLAEDHLDWHPDMDHYARAKSRIWEHQVPTDVAVVNADDPAVMRAAAAAPSTVVTFSGAGADADWRVDGGDLVGPGGVLLPVAELPRRLPLDLANALAAAAGATSAGATADACRHVLRTFEGLPHRVQLVRESGGVRFYDDSKATTPASVLAAVEGFDSVVLIAGGRNKGLDLGVLAAATPKLRGVVAIGDAADEVARAFAGRVPVTTASSMDDAVTAARSMAQTGDVVLLSPGCASFDWYRSYGERGDDFVRAVGEQVDR